MAHLTKNWTIKFGDFSRAGEVSLKVQGLLKSIGFETEIIRRVAVCAYEAEMNVVMHGGDGNLFLTINPSLISLEVNDDGGGIKDVEMAMKEGFSTASNEAREMGFGAGMGLPNIKKNSDEVELHSEQGKGTQLKIIFYTGGPEDP